MKQLSYKTKNKYLLVATILAFLLIYFMAINKTIVVYGECQDLKEKLKQAEGAPEKSMQLERKIAEMTLRIGGDVDELKDTRADLLAQTSQFCKAHKIVLREFPAAIDIQQKDFSMETNIFKAEGNFSDLLGLVYELEQKHPSGKISSLHFLTETDRRTKRKSLTLTVYVQNIKKRSHEETT